MNFLKWPKFSSVLTRLLMLRRLGSMVLLCMFLLSLGTLSGWLLRSIADATEASASYNPYKKLDTFAQVLSKIERNYVEDIDDDALVYGAVKGMVKTLDPHSSFLTPKELKALRERTDGRYVGIGVEIGVENKQIIVITPLEGGPSEAVGIQKKDLILEVDGVSSFGWDIPEASKHLKGARGSSVKLLLQRATDGTQYEVEIERQTISIISVHQELLEPGYGYISIRAFTRGVSRELKEANEALQRQHGGPLEGLILDLRGNPGGLLREAVLVSNAFLSSGLIVSTEGRNGYQLAHHDARSDHAFIEKTPLVVLVNSGSASASEIVAGALQDHRRAVIVGGRTFGKGSVQNIYDLEDGSGLKLTIARYYTPAHRSIQGEGVTPDVFAEDVQLPAPKAKSGMPRERDLPGALQGTTKGSLDSKGKPLARTRDLPIRTALDQLKAYKILSGDSSP